MIKDHLQLVGTQGALQLEAVSNELAVGCAQQLAIHLTFSCTLILEPPTFTWAPILMPSKTNCTVWPDSLDLSNVKFAL